MLDHMLKGRLLLGVSMGALPTDWEVFGSLDKNKEAMFEESMFQMLEIWKNKAPYNLQGSFWKISTEKTMNLDLGLGDLMKPFQKPHPETVEGGAYDRCFHVRACSVFLRFTKLKYAQVFLVLYSQSCFDGLSMRCVFSGKPKDLMLSLSKDEGRIRFPPAERNA